MVNVLSAAEVERALPDGWRRDGTEIVRTYGFDAYLDGVTFANAVAEVAEEQHHHPTMEIGYESVTVRFTTHEVDGVTKRDLRSAGLCNDEY
ncbi:4a-hydroxytetrahydrobiopterin dehydratase [Halorubrum sp. JWXQ-INN 858]|uniref:4a-hydroxytetrahydrobiopterin dehydratase n=1 Tax=Halorubrum sp. JWXQ-INN 858 TaxID=2690782 RepID=UPI0013580EAF|nr:4a-hydroxytetrahydrobiopterin dehydratase [Halorubrum sp. JWXQ-INN 858]MWV64792.1 4a-hydroxytetrahydrobiopterin dehydratase [Halorubrum sp. JWXQ-INN 858]